MKSRLDNSWDDFIEQFIRTLLADGYTDFEILDKMMSVFRSVRESKNNSQVVFEVSGSTKDEELSGIRKPRKYPENKKNPSRINSPHNFDRTLHSRFEHAVVYVKGNKDASLATIEAGPNQRVKDIYKVISTGKEYNGDEYLKEFNIHAYDTPKGYSYLNQSVIVFDVNPAVSVGYIKNPKNYSSFRSLEDVVKYSDKRIKK